MHRRSIRRLAAVGLAATVVVGLGACSDDDDEADADAEAPADAGTDGGTDEGADPIDPAGGDTVPVEACDAFVTFSAAMVGDPAALGPAVEDLAAALPESLADAGETLSTAAAAGEEGMGGPEFTGALTEVGDALYNGCEADEQLDVEGVDYGFEGLPAEIGAGRVALRFTNGTEAEEIHELVLVKRNEGTTETVDELLALPPDQLMGKVTMAGVVFVEAPGASSAMVLDLEPGEYVAICMVPVGGAEEGPPHAQHGMVAELSVA